MHSIAAQNTSPAANYVKAPFWALFVVGFFFSGLAFMLVQAPYIGVQNFFTPMNHDDFSALAHSPGILPWFPRPVSSNFMFNLGSLGPGYYYSCYFALWMSCLALTQIFAFRAFDIRPNFIAIAVASYATAAAWFSLVPGAITLQYVGLTTNGLSYLLGISAAIVAVSSLGARFGVVRYAAFLLLTLLSAFSKEDMALFLVAVCLYRGYRDYTAGVPFRNAAGRAFVLLAIVIAAYVASLAHSRLAGSPFVSGAGSYDMASPLQNVLRNLPQYWSISRGTQLALIFGIGLLLAGAARALIRGSRDRAELAIVAALPLTLALPYLLLPRFFGYYTVNFVPLIVALIFPAVWLLCSGPVLDRWRFGLAVSATAIASLLLHVVDFKPRQPHLAWYSNARDVSRRQIDEVLRAQDLGLSECRKILVTGVSNNYGPFFNPSAEYVNRLLGRDANWRIVAEPNTILGAFVEATILNDPRWVYVSSRDADEEAWTKQADCRLAYTAPSYRAVFEKAPTTSR